MGAARTVPVQLVLVMLDLAAPNAVQCLDGPDFLPGRSGFLGYRKLEGRYKFRGTIVVAIGKHTTRGDLFRGSFLKDLSQKVVRSELQRNILTPVCIHFLSVLPPVSPSSLLLSQAFNLHPPFPLLLPVSDSLPQLLSATVAAS